jgi:predicted RNase H-like nuclease (RuvC/YqgF family)
MADNLPNYRLEMHRLRAQISAQQATIDRQKLENLELKDRIDRNSENIEASYKSLKELQDKYSQLEQVHGKLE